MRALSVCLSVALLLFAATPAFAQSLEKLDVANGERLAQKLCVNCHQVAPDESGTVLADVPGFPAIANRPGMTRAKIEAYVLSPHPAMPTIQFTRDELADISAYIMSLREEDEAE
jgi:mono/diheme cytochrome c family protein